MRKFLLSTVVALFVLGSLAASNADAQRWRSRGSYYYPSSTYSYTTPSYSYYYGPDYYTTPSTSYYYAPDTTYYPAPTTGGGTIYYETPRSTYYYSTPGYYYSDYGWRGGRGWRR